MYCEGDVINIEGVFMEYEEFINLKTSIFDVLKSLPEYKRTLAIIDFVLDECKEEAKRKSLLL